MLNNVLISAMVGSVVLLMGCSSPTEITTRDGEKTVTSDKPEVDEDTGFLRYEENGDEVQVNPVDVRSIESVD